MSHYSSSGPNIKIFLEPNENDIVVQVIRETACVSAEFVVLLVQ